MNLKNYLLMLSLCFCSLTFADEVANDGLGFVAPTVVGKTNVYSPNVGEIIFDQSDSKFYGFDSSSQWQSLTAASASSPAGMIIAFGGTTAPAGYLLCDGQAVSRTTYSNLFAAIGTNFGSGDGSTTFNLPNLQGQFLRGADNGSGVDPDVGMRSGTGGVGSNQADQIASHSHQQRTSVANAGSVMSVGASNRGSSTASAESTVAFGGNETRPKNVAVNYLIKF